MATLWFDSGWPPPLSSVTAYAGYLFYLAPGDNRRPDPSAATLQQHLAAGRDLAPIWQAGKVDIAAGGFDLGAAHAKAADADADAKGVPPWVPIIYACDADRTFVQVGAYYRGVLSVPGRPVGFYGGDRPFKALNAQLGIAYFMQAAARSWSDESPSPLAHFWQRDPNVAVPGGTVDQVVPLKPYPTWKRRRMAQPYLSNDRLLAALRGEGLNVIEWPRWRDKCRCHDGSHQDGVGPRKSFDVIGTIVHHTGGDTSDVRTYVNNVLVADNATSPDFPLKCNFAVGYDGEVYLLSGGLANHDLHMSQGAYDALTNGTFSLDGYQDLRRSGGDLVGSQHAYGIEQIAAMTPNAKQQEASQRICAAISRAYGWDGRDCAGHGEVGYDRSYEDPNLNMGAFRRAVMTRVAAGPNQQQGEDIMASLADLEAVIAKHTDSIAENAAAKVLAQFRSEGVSGAADPGHNGVGALRADLPGIVAKAVADALAAQKQA